MTTNYSVALAASVLGGIGFSTQDACSPVILSGAFPTGYASAMSAGEAFFGAGCFLPPLLMSILLPLGLPFYSVYYLFAGLAVVLLLVLPFAEVPDTKQLAQEGGHAANPLFLRAQLPGWLLLALFAVTYCAVPNTVNLYTTTFAASIGIPEAVGGLLLTAYNVGSMRRGYLYQFAQGLGCNKIALGHHFDDVIETILMSMLYGAEIKTMASFRLRNSRIVLTAISAACCSGKR